MGNLLSEAIFGNRDFFPDELITEVRADIQTLFTEFGIRGIWLGSARLQARLGRDPMPTPASAPTCSRCTAARSTASLSASAQLRRREGCGDTLEAGWLNVPVLVQAYPDDLDGFNVERRRDAFAAKSRSATNLRQYSFSYSLTDAYQPPTERRFQAVICRTTGVCRWSTGLRNACLGAVGARPNALNTTRQFQSCSSPSAFRSRPSICPSCWARATG